MWYNKMLRFLTGLLLGIARKVSEGWKMETKKLEIFQWSGVFNEVVEATLYHN